MQPSPIRRSLHEFPNPNVLGRIVDLGKDSVDISNIIYKIRIVFDSLD